MSVRLPFRENNLSICQVDESLKGPEQRLFYLRRVRRGRRGRWDSAFVNQLASASNLSELSMKVEGAPEAKCESCEVRRVFVLFDPVPTPRIETSDSRKLPCTGT